MSEVEPQSLTNPFIVRTDDGRQYAGAETQDQAVVLAGALFTAGATGALRSGRLEVIDTAQGDAVVAVIQTYQA